MTCLEIVHTESSCGWGGQELRIIDEASGCIERGHHVTLVAAPESRIAVESQRRSIPLIPLPIAKRSFSALLALRRYLASRRIDIVNTHSSTDSWLTAISVQTLRKQPRIVRTRHVSAPLSRNPATRWLYGRAASHVVTTGSALRLQVMQQAHLQESRVTSIPTGIDLARFKPGDRNSARQKLGISSAEFVIGIVATLRSWKGHRYLVDAFASIADQETRLVIVGSGPGEENLRKQIADLGIGGRVTMPGNQSDVVPWLQAMDVFALPSYANEGVPQSIMQAHACGIPVISTPVGSIEEIVCDTQTGLMVQPRDVDSLRLAILRMKQDDSLRKRLAEAGLLQAQARYSSTLMVDGMLKIFHQVIGNPA